MNLIVEKIRKNAAFSSLGKSKPDESYALDGRTTANGNAVSGEVRQAACRARENVM